MAYMKSPPIVLVFSLSALAILLAMVVTVGLLYCYHKLTVPNSAGRSRDVEVPATVQPRNDIPMPQVDPPKASKSLHECDEEEYDDDPFVIGDQEGDEDPFEDVFEKENPSVTASISQYYFENPKSDDFDRAQGDFHPPSGNSWGSSWQTDPEAINVWTGTPARDSFDSVPSIAQQPIPAVALELATPGRSLVR